MTLADLKTLEKAVHLFKQYEYGKLKEIPGKDIDVFMQECREYNKKLKMMRQKIEKFMNKKSINELSSNIFKILETFLGEKSEGELIKEFDSKMIKKGKVSPRFLPILKNIVSSREKISQNKLSSIEVDNIKKDAIELMNSLVEYGQRADIVASEKGVMQITYQGRKTELALMGEKNFLIEGKDIKKIENGKLTNSSKEEFEKALAENKGKLNTTISGEVFLALEKALGKFDITF